MTLTPDQEREILLDAIGMLDELARVLRLLHNPRIEAYCLADLEGSGAGWLGGNFIRDILEEHLAEIEGGEHPGELPVTHGMDFFDR